MNLRLFFLIIIGGLMLLSACSSNQSSNDTIDHKYLYTGFVNQEEPLSELPQDVVVITNRESWNEFRDKYHTPTYFPYPNYQDSFDFTNEYLVYYQHLGAKPNINVAYQISKLYIQDHTLMIDLKPVNESFYITVEFNEPQIFKYVIVASIKKDDVPIDLKNMYKKNHLMLR